MQSINILYISGFANGPNRNGYLSNGLWGISALEQVRARAKSQGPFALAPIFLISCGKQCNVADFENILIAN